jgi:catechol 2,3-dioxygenase-like lactoylglutathione lyase family enzyme
VSRLGLGGVACLSLSAVVGAGGAASALAPADGAVVLGLDHVPVAVAKLEEAAERYRALGFTLKPGRLHDNGIRNQHAKFADGTELELITAPEARDALTSTYRRHLAEGDGPAFLALFAPSLDAAAHRLDAEREPYHRDDALLDFDGGEGLGYLFLGPRNHSPTDRPEYFEHANGASSLVAVWLAGDLSRERRLLATLGARVADAEVHVPGPVHAAVARFAQGDVVLLPSDRQIVPGRRVVGATVRVRSLRVVEAILARAIPASAAPVRGTSVYLPPTVTHGLWLELRESP